MAMATTAITAAVVRDKSADSLQGLAQTQIIRQDAIQTVVFEEEQPVYALLLVNKVIRLADSGDNA